MPVYQYDRIPTVVKHTNPRGSMTKDELLCFPQQAF
jgi:hypothetical protein